MARPMEPRTATDLADEALAKLDFALGKLEVASQAIKKSIKRIQAFKKLSQTEAPKA